MHVSVGRNLEEAHKNAAENVKIFRLECGACEITLPALCGESGPWSYLNKWHSLIALPWGLLALCRWTLRSDCYRYVSEWPYKLWTSPMVQDGSDGKRSGKVGTSRSGVPYVRTRFRLGVENGLADARRNSQTILARQNSQGANGDKEKSIHSYSLFSWQILGLETTPGWCPVRGKWWPRTHAHVLHLKYPWTPLTHFQSRPP